MNSTSSNTGTNSSEGIQPVEDRSGPSDNSLIRRFRSGDEAAATQLYLKYAKKIRRLAANGTGQDLKSLVEPDDVVQSVFRTFFRRVSNGDYDAPDGGELWKLLLVISLNKIRANGVWHRAQKRDVRLTQHGDAVEFESRESTEDEAALSELKMVVDELIAGLPESHQEIVRLRIENYSVQEISDRTQRSMRTVERVLQGFRGGLLDRIGDASHGDEGQ
jgi:RNA polymerase sigma-70 factor (ECF subfamily)